LAVVGLGVGLLGQTANAAPMIPQADNITMKGGALVTASDALSNFGDGTVLTWLGNDVTAYNGLEHTSYPAPPAGAKSAPPVKVDIGSSPSSIDLTLGGYDYVFLHWGGKGGGWAQAYYVGGLTGSYEFDVPGTQHPEYGGLSSYSFYGPTPNNGGGGGGGGSGGNGTPDGGTTLVLLGASFFVVEALRRRLAAA